nr:ribonuclease H-like domain-containing protein [Tanacetum cinerariifolium]
MSFGAYEDERVVGIIARAARVAKEREVSCEAQQGQSGVKRKLFESCRNNMGNEPILALPEGSENFVVMCGARLARLYVYEAVARHEVHMSSIPDRDGMYIEVLERMYKSLGTRVVMSTAYHPWTDGQSERTFRTLENMFRACVRNVVVVGILTFREAEIEESKMIGLEFEQETTDKEVILLAVELIKFRDKIPLSRGDCDTRDLSRLSESSGNQLFSAADLGNSLIWASAMKLALQIKHKIGFITGTCVRTDYLASAPLLEQWDRCNVVVLNWILSSLSQKVYLGHVFSNNAATVCNELKNTYDRIDGSIVFNLLQKTNSFKQRGLPIFEYYHKLNSLWREYEILTKLPNCTFSARLEVANYDKMLKFMQFLMGLDDIYQPIKSSILTREVLPEAKDAFLIISREESHRGIPFSSGTVKTEKAQASAFVSKQSDMNRSRNNNWSNNGNNVNRGVYDNLLYKNCGLKGHTIDRCFELIGYPLSFKRNPNLKPNTNGNSKSNSGDFRKGSSNNSETKTSGNNFYKFFCANVTINGLNNHMGWIIDSGANQHMSNSIKDMVNLVYVFDLKLTVDHPNGTLAKINHVGNLKLNNDVMLFDVLVILEYTVSLLSVHKLIKDSKFNVGFAETKCYIQGLKKGRVLGTSSEFGGLYLSDKEYNKSTVANNSKFVSCFVSKEVWHCRLGHPANQVLKLLKGSLNLSNIDHEGPCEDETEFEVTNLIFFNCVESDPKPKASISPNDDEEGSSCRDGSVHQSGPSHSLDQPEVDEHIPTSGFGSDLQGSGNDGLVTATPIDENTSFDGNVGFNDQVPVFQNVFQNQTEEVNLRKSFISNLNKNLEPSSFKEASKDPNWISAMNNEMNALYENDTWYLVDLPFGRKPIGSKWVFKIKYKSNDEVSRFKARVVAKGFGQKEGLDYEETFSHVYMLPPPGFFDPSDKRVCKLKKSLFKIKDVGELKYFLGIEVLKVSGGLCLSQRKYCLELLHDFGLLACRHVLTPLPKNILLAHKETEKDKFLVKITSYQRLIAKLIYLTLTRPHISYVVHCLSQHMHAPLKSHFDIALRLLKYLKLAPGFGVQFVKRQSGFDIKAFSDSDWAKCPVTRRYVSGYCVFVNGCLVSWKSKKQVTLSKSLAEAEYKPMAAATCEIMWIVKIMSDLKIKNLLPAELYCDNKVAMKIVANPIMHEKTKHFDLDVHFIREKVCSGLIKTAKVESKDNVADILTKALGSFQHGFLTKKFAGSKDRPPMLAPGNYIQWKSRIKRYIDTKPNHELIHYCLKNPPYKLWKTKPTLDSDGNPTTSTERVFETYKTVTQEIRDQLNAEAEAVQIILTGIDNDIY